MVLRDRSLFIASGGGGGGGGEDFTGDHLIFRRTKGGSVKTFRRIQRRTTQVCLENEDMGGGGIAKVIKSYRGDPGEGGSLQ